MRPVSLCSLAGVLILAATAPAQAPFLSDPAFLIWRDIAEVTRCGECHVQPTAFRRTEFVRLVESYEWLFCDKHAVARQLIMPIAPDQLETARQQVKEQFDIDEVPEDWIGPSNVLSYQITQRLGWDVNQQPGYEKFRDNCLTCHGGYDGSTAAAERFGGAGVQQPGIACTHCHGPLDDESAGVTWVAQHERPEWRTKTDDEKIAAGNRPLTDTVRQASTCYECHVGDLETNRFVTHAMYAAGHPPLPGVELETFCESLQQPRSVRGVEIQPLPHHWQALEALPNFENRAQYLSVRFPELFPDAAAAEANYPETAWDTRSVVLGGLVAKQAQLQLLASATESDHWGDYALYDCAACHHQLYWPSPRQQRGYVSRYRSDRLRPPGRPRLPEWPDVLLNAFLEASGAAEVDREPTLQLEAALDSVPFGEAQTVGPIARAASDSLTTAIDKAKATPFDADVSLALLRRTLQAGTQENGKLIEFHAARQIVWVVRQLTGEISRLAPGRLPPAFTSAVESLPQTIPLDLPAGRNQQISQDLGQTLRIQSEYQPARLQQQLHDLLEMLP